MQHHNERRLMRFTPQQLYAVVSDVQHYRDFVPWCVDSRELRRQGNIVEAELRVGFKLFTESYVSRVTLDPPRRVEALAKDTTVFAHLRNVWEFAPGPNPASTWLTFRVEFQFQNALYSRVSGMFLDEVVTRMVQAFEVRCKQLYGRQGGRKAVQEAEAAAKAVTASAPPPAAATAVATPAAATTAAPAAEPVPHSAAQRSSGGQVRSAAQAPSSAAAHTNTPTVAPLPVPPASLAAPPPPDVAASKGGSSAAHNHHAAREVLRRVLAAPRRTSGHEAAGAERGEAAAGATGVGVPPLMGEQEVQLCMDRVLRAAREDSALGQELATLQGSTHFSQPELLLVRAKFDAYRRPSRPMLDFHAFLPFLAGLQQHVVARTAELLDGEEGLTMLANMDGLHLEALSPAEAADLRRGAALAAACLRSLRVAPGDMEMLARHQFRAFDTSRVGAVTFPNFAQTLSVLLRGADEERARFAFRCYDSNRDGFVTLRELRSMALATARAQRRVLHAMMAYSRADVRQQFLEERAGWQAVPGARGGQAAVERALEDAAGEEWSEDALLLELESVLLRTMQQGDTDGDGRMSFDEFVDSPLCRADLARFALHSSRYLVEAPRAGAQQ